MYTLLDEAGGFEVNMDARDLGLALSGRENCRIIIGGAPGVGEMRLWVPEGIMSEAGASSVYPRGGEWEGGAFRLSQQVNEDQLIGGGNCPLIDDHTFECCGFRFPLDEPVRWNTTVEARNGSVVFEIEITNTGGGTIRKAGAAVCLKFHEAGWWSDDRTFVVSGGEVKALAELGRGAGADDVFEAYLLEGAEFDHPFYRGFWGFNDHRLDIPVMASENPEAGTAVVIRAEAAYFLHSNRDNPCTDVMLAFGDVAPDETARARGEVRILRGSDVLEDISDGGGLR